MIVIIVTRNDRPTTSEKAAAESLDASPEDGAQLHDLLPFTIGDQTSRCLPIRLRPRLKRVPWRLAASTAAVVG
jgi:hypothetical protein